MYLGEPGYWWTGSQMFLAIRENRLLISLWSSTLYFLDKWTSWKCSGSLASSETCYSFCIRGRELGEVLLWSKYIYEHTLNLVVWFSWCFAFEQGNLVFISLLRSSSLAYLNKVHLPAPKSARFPIPYHADSFYPAIFLFLFWTSLLTLEPPAPLWLDLELHFQLVHPSASESGRDSHPQSSDLE